jgi:hypothetical protein
LKPSNSFTIISKKWGQISLLTGFIYIYHIVWAIYGVDKFCDISRTYPCFPGQDPTKTASVYNPAIGMVAMFHLAEWIRQTIILTTALVNVNLMPLYYFMSINVVFGYIALIYGIITRFSGDGVACSA